METFRVKAVPGEGTCTLFLSGEADLAVAPDIIELGTMSLSEASIMTLIVDLAAVTFIDSTSIGALVQLRNVADAQGKRLALENVPVRVRGWSNWLASQRFSGSPDRPADPSEPVSNLRVPSMIASVTMVEVSLLGVGVGPNLRERIRPGQAALGMRTPVATQVRSRLPAAGLCIHAGTRTPGVWVDGTVGVDVARSVSATWRAARAAASRSTVNAANGSWKYKSIAPASAGVICSGRDAIER